MKPGTPASTRGRRRHDRRESSHRTTRPSGRLRPGSRDREAARVDAIKDDKPHTCPYCGTAEPNGPLLSTGHGVDWRDGLISGFPFKQHPIFGDKCMAQWLVTNHIYYAVNHDSPSLGRDVAHGRELGLDVDQIIAEAEANAKEEP